MNCIIPFIAITLFALIGIGVAINNENTESDSQQTDQIEVNLRLPHQKFSDMIDHGRFEVDNG